MQNQKNVLHFGTEGVLTIKPAVTRRATQSTNLLHECNKRKEVVDTGIHWLDGA